MRLLFTTLLFLGATLLGRAQTAPIFKLEGNALVLPAPLSFRPGTAELTAAATPALEHIKSYLDAKTYISLLRLEGHVVGDGGQALSEQRAQAVAAWLVAHGVDCHRLLPGGFGSTKPAGSTPEANTRIEVVNAALRGRPIGGLPVDGGGHPAASPCQP